MIAPPATRRLRLRRPLDLRLTLAPTRVGRGDPTTLLRYDEAYRATRSPLGPATLHVIHRGDEVAAEAWGEGAEWVLDQLPALLGEHDADPFEPRHALIADLQRRTPGLRFGRTDRVVEALVAAVCGHKVSGFEAKRAFRQIVTTFGEPAPGPAQLELIVPPDPAALATAGHQAFHPLGLERSRADIVRRAGARAQTLEELIAAGPDEAESQLRSLAGVGVWISALVRQVALGDHDVVPVGDEHLKHIVAWVFTGERHGTDAQMLELLEPFRGHRARVLRLISAAGLGPPTRGPDAPTADRTLDRSGFGGYSDH